MSKDAEKPEDEMPALPEMFLEQFRCRKCTKYLRPPIRTVCKNGHKVCDICFTALATPTSYCPVSPGCMRSSENITDFAIGNMIKVGSHNIFLQDIFNYTVFCILYPSIEPEASDVVQESRCWVRFLWQS